MTFGSVSYTHLDVYKRQLVDPVAYERLHLLLGVGTVAPEGEDNGDVRVADAGFPKFLKDRGEHHPLSLIHISSRTGLPLLLPVLDPSSSIIRWLARIASIVETPGKTALAPPL